MVFERRRARRRGLIVGATAGHLMTKRRNKADAADEPADSEPEVAPSSNQDDSVEQIKQYAELRDQGVLTEEEFAAKKKQILGL